MAHRISTQLKKGVLDHCVLALLAEGDRYAYDLAKRLANAIGTGQGTIYPLMRRLQSDGRVDTYLRKSTSGPPRTYYRLTEAGRACLVEQRREWHQFINSVNAIVGANS